MYSPQVLDHFEHPRNSGELPEPTARIRVENPVCGDVLELSLKVEQGTITAVRFRARGCVAAVACASKLTESVLGQPVAKAKQLERELLVSSLGGLPEASTHAISLALDALAGALEQLS